MLKPVMVDPKPVQINVETGHCAFFHGDRWVDIGPVYFCSDFCHGHVDTEMVEEFLVNRQRIDESTMDWFNWGPRVN